MNRYKHLIISFFTIIIVVPCVLAILMYIYDPLHIFRPNLRYENDSMYLNAKNIIATENFDAAIVGTSMLEGTDANEVSHLFHQNFVNLSMPGITFSARFKFIDYLIQTKKVKTIITSFDRDQNVVEYLFDDLNRVFNIPFWLPLYDDNKFNDFKVYLNQKYFNCLFIWSKSEKCIGKLKVHKSTNMINYKKKKGIEDWENNNIRTALKFINGGYSDKKYSQEEYFNAINKKIFALVKKYNKTTFIFIIPPYSTLSDALLQEYQPHAYQSQIEFIKYFVIGCHNFPNCKVYGFDNEDFTNDLSNYFDVLHYETHINSYMMRNISNGKNQLDQLNIEQYINRFKNKVNNYDVKSIKQEILKLSQDKHID